MPVTAEIMLKLRQEKYKPEFDKIREAMKAEHTKVNLISFVFFLYLIFLTLLHLDFEKVRRPCQDPKSQNFPYFIGRG
jgi:hypothetical protein